MTSRSVRRVAAVLAVALAVSACSTKSDWTRRDMPIDGLEQAVTYNLHGPADTDKEVNEALLRGMNEGAPTLDQKVEFGRMSGTKTQDVTITLPDGTLAAALGMVKTKRFAGLSNYMTLESATYSGVDADGHAVCGAKIRLDFNRNLTQYPDPEKRDFSSLWYYDIPCAKDGTEFNLDFDRAVLRATVLNEVWQARIASGSFFFNMGHSVTAIGGPGADLPGGWWTHWDVPETTADAVGASQLMADMVKSLEGSARPWIDFTPGTGFDDAHLIYSAGDADQYANVDRLLLNRQREYAVFYRPDPQTEWDFITVKPVYNFEWNDVTQVLAGINGWNPANPLHDKLDEAGNPKDINDAVVKEIERVGWANSPNTSLEQIQFLDRDGEVLYAMTVRAFVGARDTLVLFGPTNPSLADAQRQAGAGEDLPMPVLYDEHGKPLPDDQQPYTAEQWAAWQREATMWNFLKDNPRAVGADLAVQYRFSDNSSWAPITCHDGDGHAYTCGYRPVEWDLSASYLFDGGDVRKAWTVMNLVGEVGARTLGLSYASGLYQGTGMLFAMSQVVHRDEFFEGYTAESIWRFDARAQQLPDTLAEAWANLHAE